jgi:hypothetical protein
MRNDRLVPAELPEAISAQARAWLLSVSSVRLIQLVQEGRSNAWRFTSAYGPMADISAFAETSMSYGISFANGFTTSRV